MVSASAVMFAAAQIRRPANKVQVLYLIIIGCNELKVGGQNMWFNKLLSGSSAKHTTLFGQIYRMFVR
jgi:hypothetical protein